MQNMMCTRGGAVRGRGGAVQGRCGARTLAFHASVSAGPATRFWFHSTATHSGCCDREAGRRTGRQTGRCLPGEETRARGLGRGLGEGRRRGAAARGGGAGRGLQSELADLVGVQPVLRGEEDLVVLDDVPACTGTRARLCSCAGLCAAERCTRGEVRGEVHGEVRREAGCGARCQAGQLTLARPCPWSRAVSSTCSPSSPSPP